MTPTITKKVMVKSTITTTEEKEFTFPVYTRYESYCSTVFVKTDAELYTIIIRLSEVGINDVGGDVLESAEIKFDSGSGWLPHDQVKEITAAEFMKAVAEARAKIERVFS